MLQGPGLTPSPLPPMVWSRPRARAHPPRPWYGSVPGPGPAVPLPSPPWYGTKSCCHRTTPQRPRNRYESSGFVRRVALFHTTGGGGGSTMTMGRRGRGGRTSPGTMTMGGGGGTAASPGTSLSKILYTYCSGCNNSFKYSQ